MTHHSLVYCGAGLVTLGLIALYLVGMCMVYAMFHVCIEEHNRLYAIVFGGVLVVLVGAGLIILGLLLS